MSSDLITVNGREYRVPAEVMASARRFTFMVSNAAGQPKQPRADALRSLPRRAAPPYPCVATPPGEGWIVWVQTEEGRPLMCEPVFDAL